LWIPVTQFDLVNSRLDFQWIGRQVLKSSNAETENTAMHGGQPSFAWLKSKKKKGNELADADVSSFSLLNHFFHFLPSRIRIIRKIEVNLLIIILECHWPLKQIRKLETACLRKRFTSE